MYNLKTATVFFTFAFNYYCFRLPVSHPLYTRYSSNVGYTRPQYLANFLVIFISYILLFDININFSKLKVKENADEIFYQSKIHL